MLSPFKALATCLELEQQCITPENKKGIPPSHKHELYTACSQCYDFSRNREKNPFGSFPLETNISYYHCLYLIKIFKIPVLLQFGSSQNLKVWGFVTCNHLTSKLDKHQPKQHPCYSSGKGAAASHRLGWAGWSYWFCGSGVFSCILTFPLLPGWFLNMSFPAWFHPLLVPTLTFGYSILGLVFSSAKIVRSEMYSGVTLLLFLFLQTHPSWVVVVYSADFSYHVWANSPLFHLS